jgi:hypothetical protein
VRRRGSDYHQEIIMPKPLLEDHQTIPDMDEVKK